VRGLRHSEKCWDSTSAHTHKGGRIRLLGVALGPDRPHAFTTINHRATTSSHQRARAAGPARPLKPLLHYHYWADRRWQPLPWLPQLLWESAAPRVARLAPDGGDGSPLGARVTG